VSGYNTYRHTCSSSNYRGVNSWAELQDQFLDADDVRKLRAVYQHVDDIDLFAGGVLETEHRDALVGPVFKCLLGDQFIRLKRGDRFWYEGGPGDARFSRAQLREVKRASLARILCDNTDIQQVQPLALRTERGAANKRVPCTDLVTIPSLDLTPWQE